MFRAECRGGKEGGTEARLGAGRPGDPNGAVVVVVGVAPAEALSQPPFPQTTPRVVLGPAPARPHHRGGRGAQVTEGREAVPLDVRDGLEDAVEEVGAVLRDRLQDGFLVGVGHGESFPGAHEGIVGEGAVLFRVDPGAEVGQFLVREAQLPQNRAPHVAGAAHQPGFLVGILEAGEPMAVDAPIGVLHVGRGELLHRQGAPEGGDGGSRRWVGPRRREEGRVGVGGPAGHEGVLAEAQGPGHGRIDRSDGEARGHHALRQNRGSLLSQRVPDAGFLKAADQPGRPLPCADVVPQLEAVVPVAPEGNPAREGRLGGRRRGTLEEAPGDVVGLVAEGFPVGEGGFRGPGEELGEGSRPGPRRVFGRGVPVEEFRGLPGGGRFFGPGSRGHDVVVVHAGGTGDAEAVPVHHEAAGGGPRHADGPDGPDVQGGRRPLQEAPDGGHPGVGVVVPVPRHGLCIDLPVLARIRDRLDDGDPGSGGPQIEARVPRGRRRHGPAEEHGPLAEDSQQQQQQRHRQTPGNLRAWPPPSSDPTRGRLGLDAFVDRRGNRRWPGVLRRGTPGRSRHGSTAEKVFGSNGNERGRPRNGMEWNETKWNGMLPPTTEIDRSIVRSTQPGGATSDPRVWIECVARTIESNHSNGTRPAPSLVRTNEYHSYLPVRSPRGARCDTHHAESPSPRRPPTRFPLGSNPSPSSLHPPGRRSIGSPQLATRSAETPSWHPSLTGRPTHTNTQTDTHTHSLTHTLSLGLPNPRLVSLWNAMEDPDPAALPPTDEEPAAILPEDPPMGAPPRSQSSVENDDDDDDDDDDNWSRQVETDEIHHAASSVDAGGDDEARASASAEPAEAGLLPQRDEPTLKEKLVERERQRRVETERARLKRRFARRTQDDEGRLELEGVPEYLEDHHHHHHHDGEEGKEGDDRFLHRDTGSVAGTVGEGSIVAPVGDVLLEADSDQKTLNYPMERFLQEQGTILEEEATLKAPNKAKRDPQNQGVVMERFLQEPVVVAEEGTAGDAVRPSVDRSVSFDMESPNARVSSVPGTPPASDSIVGPPPSSVGDQSIPEQVTAPARMERRSLESFGNGHEGVYTDDSVGVGTSVGGASLANTSMDCVTSDLPEAIPDTPDLSDARALVHSSTGTISLDGHLPPESPSIDQPRVLGLTQAEIEELAAIEEVSQQNAPPSERDDLSASSFVGELVSDLGGPGMEHHPGATTLSQGTPTTAMESASLLSGNQSAQRTVSDQALDDHQSSIDALETASVNSNLAASITSGTGISVTANPPSEMGRDEHLLSPLPDMPPALQDPPSPDDHALPVVNLTPALSSSPPPDDLADLATLNAGVVNRQIRPGMIKLPPRTASNSNANEKGSALASPIRRIMSVPDKMHFDLDGFDYDKDAPSSPGGPNDLLPSNDLWSPGSKMSFERSPYFVRQTAEPDGPAMPSHPLKYGTSNETSTTDATPARGYVRSKEKPEAEGPCDRPSLLPAEKELLLPKIPSEIIARGQPSRASQLFASGTFPNTSSMRSVLDGVFGDVRAESASAVVADQDQAKECLEDSSQQRALQRSMALAVTLLLEIPVLLTIMGGGKRLCGLIGFWRYQLLLGFFFLSGAISGSVGLQASTWTTRAVSQGRLTPQNYTDWLLKEVGAAFFVGISVSGIVGIVAFILGWFSLSFAWAVSISQFFSVLAAGLTGTLAPLVFSFLLGRDAPAWGGPLETAIQDLVGSFAMVACSYQILSTVGPLPKDASDLCAAVAVNL